MQFGTEKTIYVHGDNQSTMTIIKKLRHGEVAKSMKLYKERVKVLSGEDEQSQYQRFSKLLADKREHGTLAVDKDDHTTTPSFMVEFPKANIDGSYFVVMCWAEHA